MGKCFQFWDHRDNLFILKRNDKTNHKKSGAKTLTLCFCFEKDFDNGPKFRLHAVSINIFFRDSV